MTIDIPVLCRNLTPEQTVLLFGAGSSIPSGGPTAKSLSENMQEHFRMPKDASLSLAELSMIVEHKNSRDQLIDFLRTKINSLKPTGSLLTIPLYPWKSIFTTNYDTLIEQVYKRKHKEIAVFKSNYDFGLQSSTVGAELYKLHGCISQDTCDGHKSKIIITTKDYDDATDYREQLFDTFQLHISSGNLVIIGHSLSDPDLKVIIDEALRRKRQAGGKGKIYLLSYVSDPDRAIIYETRGIEVCFGSIDDFFAEFSKKLPETQMVFSLSDDPLDISPNLRCCTIDVKHAAQHNEKNVTKMFNGSPANYSDISYGLTFERDISNKIESQLVSGEKPISYILGTAGVGKTTVIRQIMLRLLQRDFYCWEHNDDYPLPYENWLKINNELKKRKQNGVLFIDDCHSHMMNVNKLIDALSTDKPALRIILASAKHAWNPRQKSLGIFNSGEGYSLSQLSKHEINSLIDLLDSQNDIRRLVEDKFLGFKRAQRIERLEQRCGSDMFVCMKNIFGFDDIDNIILREYANLAEIYQDLYRTVAAMEAAGVKVHRQLIIRTLGIEAQSIQSILDNLTDIISEYTIDDKKGLYGWKVRHSVVADILTKYKYSDPNEAYNLFSIIIENLIASYDIEIRTIREMCDMNNGIGRIPDKNLQNSLLRKMISTAPSERVPRHRLISNLIDQEEFQQAETEIKIFEQDLSLDAPVRRYKTLLMVRKAEHTAGLLLEDRSTLLRQAATHAEKAISLFPDDKNMYRSYCEVGLAFIRISNNWETFDNAITLFRRLESRIQDPDITRMLGKIENISRRYSNRAA